MKQGQKPNWHPVSLLPTIADIIDGELADAKEHYATLLEARYQPHVFDEELISRSIKLHTEQKDFLSIFREQLNRWSKTDLSENERKEVGRLDDQIDYLHKALCDILKLADELSRGTIEKVLAKSDTELGLEFLLNLSKKG